MVVDVEGGTSSVCTAAVVGATVVLAKQALSLWSHLPAAREVFTPLLRNIST